MSTRGCFRFHGSVCTIFSAKKEEKEGGSESEQEEVWKRRGTESTFGQVLKDEVVQLLSVFPTTRRDD
jgi:hypothetical protein